jgi:DNA-binding LytR/AlgR family response regulator
MLGNKLLYFHAHRKMVKVFLDEIIYIESIKDYINIHTENCPALMVKLSLSKVISMLPEYLFLRIHRSYVVSIDKVTAFTQSDLEIGCLKSQLEGVIRKSQIN